MIFFLNMYDPKRQLFKNVLTQLTEKISFSVTQNY